MRGGQSSPEGGQIMSEEVIMFARGGVSPSLSLPLCYFSHHPRRHSRPLRILCNMPWLYGCASRMNKKGAWRGERDSVLICFHGEGSIETFRDSLPQNHPSNTPLSLTDMANRIEPSATLSTESDTEFQKMISSQRYVGSDPYLSRLRVTYAERCA